MKFKVEDETKILVLLKEPISVGTSWTAANGEATVEIQSVSEKVATPAGNYQNVIKVRFFISNDEEDFFYFARNVGLVKETLNGFSEGDPEDSFIDKIWELKEFSIKKAESITHD